MTETSTVQELQDRERAALEAAEANGAGKTIEEMAEAGEEQGPPPVEVLEGTTGQLSLSVGGRKPDSSHVSIRSAARDVDGQYPKGETLRLTIIGRVDEIKFADTHDDYGTITATKRTHSIKPLRVEKVEVASEEE